jgi:hypothetical protein
MEHSFKIFIVDLCSELSYTYISRGPYISSSFICFTHLRFINRSDHIVSKNDDDDDDE